MRIVRQPAYGLDLTGLRGNNAYMNTVDFATRLELLLLRDARVPKKPDGGPHVTKAAELIGIGQSTLQRMLAGKSELPSRANAETIMEFLDVTFGQLIGTEPLPGDEEAALQRKRKSSVELDLKTARALASQLPPEKIRDFMRPLVAHMGVEERIRLIGMIALLEREDV